MKKETKKTTQYEIFMTDADDDRALFYHGSDTIELPDNPTEKDIIEGIESVGYMVWDDECLEITSDGNDRFFVNDGKIELHIVSKAFLDA